MPWYWPFSRNVETSSTERSTLIEGISDDTLLLFFFAVCLIGLWLYYTKLVFRLTFFVMFCSFQ
jgi:hypothetical protein